MISNLGMRGISVLFVLATLTACGGGGGGGDAGSTSGGSASSLGAPLSNNATAFAYVANSASNSVSAYTINASTGALSEVADSPFTAGIGPTSVAVDPAGRFAYVANGNSGNFTDTISVYTINPATGALSSVGATPAGRSSLRSITVDPTGKFVYTTSGGSRTSSFDVSAYTINAATGALSVAPGSPFFAGTNPSSVAVDPSGKFAYVTNQASSDVSAFAINSATGALSSIGRATAGSAPMSIAVHPSGNFAYVVNFGSDNISTYAIEAASGVLTSIGSPVATGSGPLSIGISASGRFAYVTNLNSNSVSGYTIDASTGALSSIGAIGAGGANPVSITVDSSDQFVYVANSASNDVSAYTLDATNGTLTSIGTPVAAGTGPASIITTRTSR